jgi:hypothetical protein
VAEAEVAEAAGESVAAGGSAAGDITEVEPIERVVERFAAVGETVEAESAVEVEMVVETEVESDTVVALGCSVGGGPDEADADCWRGRVGSERDG